MPRVRGGRAATISLSLARDAKAAQLHRAGGTHTVHRKYILGEIDADVQKWWCPLPNELMRVRTSARGTLLPWEFRFMRREAAQHAGAG